VQLGDVNFIPSPARDSVLTVVASQYLQMCTDF
jgi:hypothetical protein